MTRRNLILLALAAIVLSFSIAGYLSLTQRSEGVSAFMAIPRNTCAVIAVNDADRALENLVKKSLMWQELLTKTSLSDLNLKLEKIDSLLRDSPELVTALRGMKLYITFNRSGSGFGHSFIFPLAQTHGDNIGNLLERITASKSLYSKFSDRQIEQVVSVDTILGILYTARVNELLIVSASPALVEDAIRSLTESKSLAQDMEFLSVEKTAGKYTDWNLFINYRQKAAMDLLGLNVEEIEKSDINWSGWTALDATVHPDLFLLNGFSFVGDKGYLSIFRKQKAQDIDAVEIIPQDVAMFIHFGVSNYREYSRAKGIYFTLISRDKAYTDKIAHLQREYHLDLVDEMDNWVANEFGLMFFRTGEIGQSAKKVAFFRLGDKNRARSVLDQLSGSKAEPTGELSRGKIPVTALFDDLESDLFNGIDQPYYSFTDNYLLLSEYRDLLEHINREYTEGNTLKKSESYASFAENMSGQSNVYLYIKIQNSYAIYRNILNQDFRKLISKGLSKKFENFGIQFMGGRNNRLFYQHSALNLNSQSTGEGNLLWEAALDTDVVMKPQIVYNHYNNAREIFIQDVGNKIYLIDNRGNILWKRQLKEAVVGNVYQIDVFKNNKLQLLFCGESSVYLIDRKGRNVENYPYKLPAVTSNGLTVIDYEKNREYRILIGIKGGKILNFDRFGKKVEGWYFESTEEINYPLEYFLLNDKDYLVTVGSKGSVFVLNRRGEIRNKIDKRIPVNFRCNFKLELSNDIHQCKIVTSDNSGNVIKMKFNGEKELINFSQFTESHYFIYEDINNDRKNDYVFLDSNRLLAYSNAKEKLFEIELQHASSFPAVFRFDHNNTVIGLLDRPGSKVYLFNNAGNLDANFPLEGNSEYTISDVNKDDRYNLIVGLKNKLMVYNLE